MVLTARPLPDLSIRQLEYLVAVAEAPTWSLAAQRVGVSASALSQGLAELERRVGTPLFERDGRRRLVRAAALPVVDHARQVLALTADLAGWAERMSDGSAGRVRLGMIDAAAVVHFADVLATFREARPDVELHLRVDPSGALVDALATGTIDLAVCVAPPTPAPGITTTLLLTEDLTVHGPPGTVVGDPATWGPWVLFPAGSHTRAVIEDRLARLGARLDVVAESHQPDVLREMVRLGTGWTVLPASQAGSGERPLAEGPTIAERDLVLARRAGPIPDPAVDALADALRAASPVAHSSGRRVASDPTT